MNRRFAAALLAGLLAAVPARAADPARPALAVEKLLNPTTATAAKLGRLSDCVAVTPDGVAVVGDGKRLWLVGAAGARPAGVRGLSCFTFTPEGLLMGIKGRELVHLDADGGLTPLLHLPGAGMTLVPGQGDTLLLFGPEGKGRWGLYTIRPGRRVSRLLSAHDPITGAAEGGGRVLVVAGGALFVVRGKQLQLMAGEPKGTLTSVATDAAGKAVFVSDGRRVFRIENEQSAVVTDDLGGSLRWYGGGLLVFDSHRRLLVRLVELPQAGTEPGTKSGEEK